MDLGTIVRAETQDAIEAAAWSLSGQPTGLIDLPLENTLKFTPPAYTAAPSGKLLPCV